ncbi:MAG: DDE-type integrase/transposase/recombinase [Acidobacteriota bacterium]|nr:DDE-type integrase/transposase/recombinase [Acidobacteriota bacterium]
MRENDVAISKQTKDNKTEFRLQAVFEMLKGKSVKSVSERFGICRSTLYQLHRRAIIVVRREIENPIERKTPAHNRLPLDEENKAVRLCERHPTLSSYQISRKLQQLENEAINPKTIQRIRKRNCLPRVPKRVVPNFKAHRFAADEKTFIRQKIKDKLFLGGERLAWDLRNQYGIRISASTAKRIKQSILRELNPPAPKPNWCFYQRGHPHRLWHGDLMEKVTLTDEDRTAFQLTLLDDYSRAYVFCDLFREVTVNTTIQAMITAMRKYQTIPQAIVFDNGSFFKGKLLQEFCRRLNIRLIHTAVHHPQTNGKLERAFRDDMNEFYKRFDRWIFHPLKKNLSDYVDYRNRIRGHYALGGKPSATRLNEQDYFASSKIHHNLEKFAWCERPSKKVGTDGLLHFNRRKVYINPKITGQKIRIVETLDGLEAEDSAGRFYSLADYKTRICRPLEKFVCGAWIKDTNTYRFKPIRQSKRMSARNQMLRVETTNKASVDRDSNDKNCLHLAVA